MIHTEAELRELLGSPSELVTHKVVHQLDPHCRDFMAKSPFVLLSTSDATGKCDVSPRGDYPGFVQVMDANRLLIPERPGNKRFDSLRNIIANPHIGLIFIIPGLGETLRINGRASITKDERWLQQMAVDGRAPVIGIVVEVEEAYLHCAKAFHRSRLWQADSWHRKEELPSAARILAEHARLAGMSAEQIAGRLEESYSKRLY
ncbi:pyridoxamine 5'-phosphate oxidase family protein [Paenibacillus aestuarii]|uniref:Pyridoxamine 5'-phosphate oxidase family protein n=1 Tax=Paenibacillus aestuarii TaxID=516965 RepID=A0ABW0K4X8_9BACL|nr:pyridoxamine 5'-phosphate oxidase family protein [Paenibacillus aestuarii]